MKKCTFLMIVAVNTSLAAMAHSGQPSPEQKSPDKKEETKSEKILSRGYFNIFELLLTTPAPKDTTAVKKQQVEKTS